jgi:hypothetical protein
MRKENLGLETRLDNAGILEVSASPVQHLTDGPFGRQRTLPPTWRPRRALWPNTIAKACRQFKQCIYSTRLRRSGVAKSASIFKVTP